MTDTQFGLIIGTALDRFIKRNQDDFSFATGELSQLLNLINMAGSLELVECEVFNVKTSRS